MFSSCLLFLDIGGGELILILFVALMLFGGKKLPELARGLGKGIRDFKDASEGVKREINSQIDNFEAKKAQETTAQEQPAKLEEANEPPAAAVPVAGTIPVAGTVPVAEISSGAHIVPEENKADEAVHLKETPLEQSQAAHEEYKS